MKNLFLTILTLILICVQAQSDTTSQTQLYTLSEDFLNQRISWAEFKVGLLEFKRKSSFDEESLQILTSLLKKVQVPSADEKKFQCDRIVLNQLENSFTNCDLLQIPVSDLIPQIQQNEDLYIEGLPIRNVKNLKIFLPKGFVQILFRKMGGDDQILFVDSTNLDWKHIRYNPISLMENGASLSVHQSKDFKPSPFYQQKTFWFITVAVLGAIFLKDKELVIEK